MADHRDTDFNIAIGLSNFSVDQGNKLGSSGNHVAPPQHKNMDSTRILGAEIIDMKQDHKRRCFEKLVVRTERTTEENVEDVKCSLQVEVIDDTALIEATAAVSGFKNCSYKNETDNGYRKKAVPIGGSKKIKQENDVKKRRNKVSKKVVKSCSTKCVNETKSNGQTVEGQRATGKKIPEGKGSKMFRKMYGKVKVVYQRKDTKDLKMVATDLEEHQIVENQNVPIKIINGSFPESEMVNLKTSNGNEQESTIEQVETPTVNQTDDGFNPKFDNHTEKFEEKDQDASETTTVGSKKMAYLREEIEALRFVGEKEQNQKWSEVYSGLSPSVAKEYTSLIVDTDNRQPQRYNRVANCGSNRHAILSMPPVLPLCSSSNDRKFAPYGRGFRVNFH